MNEALRVLDKRGEQSYPIHLKNGETAYFQNDAFEFGCLPGENVYAEADTIVVGKNGPELYASGGTCAVAGLYKVKGKIGALLHFGADKMYDQRYAELIDALYKNFPEFRICREAYVFVDIAIDRESLSFMVGESSGTGIDEKTMTKTRENYEQEIYAWVNRISDHFRTKGVRSVLLITEGEGKNVKLDTGTDLLVCLDKDDKILYRKKIGEKKA